MSAGNKHKAKGTAYEKLLHDWLVAQDLEAERMGNWCKDHGNVDVGDIHVWIGEGDVLVIQAKCRKAVALGQWLDEAEAQALNTMTEPKLIPPDSEALGVVVHKLRGRPRGEQQVVSMTLPTLLALLKVGRLAP